MNRKNPFTQLPVRDPALLIGRDALQEDILIALQSGPVFFHGGRRSGKTSVLKCLVQKNDDQSVFHYWDAQRIGKDMNLEAATNYFGMKKGMEKEIQAAKDSDKCLVLMIDEFDALTQSERFSKEEYENLRSLVMEYSPEDFSLLVCSSYRLETMQPKMGGSELLNSFRMITMTSLEIDAGQELYTTYLEKASMPDFYEQNKEVFNKAEEMSGLHPWLLQITGQAAVDAAGNITKFLNAMKTALPNIKKTFTTLLDSLGKSKAALFCIQAMDDAQFDTKEYEEVGLTCKGRVPELFRSYTIDWLENNFETDGNQEKNSSLLLQQLAPLDNRKINELDNSEKMLLAHGVKSALVYIDNGVIHVYKNKLPESYHVK